MTDKLDAIPGSTGRKIIDGLKDAVAGNFASVTIKGQRWVRADAPQASGPASDAFSNIPFEDDADEVQTWKGLAISAIMDLRRYAHDTGPERRMVSAEAYEADAVRIEASRSAASTVEPVAETPDAKLVRITDYWRNDALEKAAGISERYGADPQIASDIRALKHAPTTSPEPDAVREALRALLAYVDRETCTHEETHRGGAIWTICDGCGRKWADDQGGFKPHCDAPEVAAARVALSRPAHGGWENISTAEKFTAHEERGIYTDNGDGLFFFKATHWRPLARNDRGGEVR